MSSSLSPDGLFKVSPIPCLCLVVGEKVNQLSLLLNLHWPCLVSVCALSAASAEMVCGWPHREPSEAAWVALLLLWQVCMGYNKQCLSHSHIAASPHFRPFPLWKKNFHDCSGLYGPYSHFQLPVESVWIFLDVVYIQKGKTRTSEVGSCDPFISNDLKAHISPASAWPRAFEEILHSCCPKMWRVKTSSFFFWDFDSFTLPFESSWLK